MFTSFSWTTSCKSWMLTDVTAFWIKEFAANLDLAISLVKNAPFFGESKHRCWRSRPTSGGLKPPDKTECFFSLDRPTDRQASVYRPTAVYRPTEFASRPPDRPTKFSKFRNRSHWFWILVLKSNKRTFKISKKLFLLKVSIKNCKKFKDISHQIIKFPHKNVQNRTCVRHSVRLLDRRRSIYRRFVGL